MEKNFSEYVAKCSVQRKAQQIKARDEQKATALSLKIFGLDKLLQKHLAE